MEGSAHGFRHDMDLGGRMEAHGFQVVAVEDVQDLADRHAAGARRRRRLDRIATVAAADRRELARPVGREIGLGDEPPAGPARFSDFLRDRALVEARGAAVHDRPKRRGEVALYQPVADRVGLAVVQEDRGGRRIAGEFRCAEVEQRHVGRRQDEAVRRKGDGGRDQFGARLRAVMLPRPFETRDRARHADREPGVGRAALDDMALRILEHGGGRGAWCLFAHVDEGRSTVGQADGHEAAPAEIAGRREHDRKRIADGDRRIDDVATLAQHIGPDLSGEMLGCHHHRVVGANRRRGGGEGGRCGEGQEEKGGAFDTTSHSNTSECILART